MVESIVVRYVVDDAEDADCNQEDEEVSVDDVAAEIRLVLLMGIHSGSFGDWSPRLSHDAM